MKILYTSDLHGEVQLYRQLFEWAQRSEAEILVLGGDLLPTLHAKGAYEEMISQQGEFIEEFLLPFFQQCREKTPVGPILLIPGNWDMAYPHLLRFPLEGVIDLTQRKHRAGGYEFIGYPFVPPTPFRPKDYEKMDDREAPWPPQKSPSYIRSSGPDGHLSSIDPQIFLRQRKTIAEDLNRLPEPENPSRAVYIMHSPPYGTRLDLIQGKAHVGSRAIRSFIENRQPLLTLHGHIHEAPEVSGSFFDSIGKTLCFNPGQSLPFEERGRLYAVILDLGDLGKSMVHTFFPSIPGDFGPSWAH